MWLHFVSEKEQPIVGQASSLTGSLKLTRNYDGWRGTECGQAGSL